MSILDKFRLDGKVAVVTGGGRGLGKAMARGMAEAGADIAIPDIQKELADETAAELEKEGVKTLPIQTDVTDVDSVITMVEQVVEEFGKIDILVNNAGICRNVAAEEMDEKDWDQVIDVNLKGVFLCAREVGKYMIEQDNGGSIINISSMSGFIVNYPQPQASYNASKAGVTMITKSLASEWAEHGIRVNQIAPGYMATEMTKKYTSSHQKEAKEYWVKPTPMERLGEPDELSGAAVYLASEASSFTTGSTLIIDGGYTTR
ncbi:MAG: glucose 1-dehydrogenase [Candidatus Bipolaricaulota bacterium]